PATAGDPSPRVLALAEGAVKTTPAARLQQGILASGSTSPLVTCKPCPANVEMTPGTVRTRKTGSGKGRQAMRPNVGRGQRVVLCLGGVCLGIGLCTGCVSERKKQDAKVDDEDQALTAEIAKKALLEMDTRQIPPGVIVPAPTEETIGFLEAGVFRKG